MLRGLILCLLLALGGADAWALRVYHIGNSLTWDLLSGLPGFAQGEGFQYDYGYHIRCGSTLKQTSQDPMTVCRDPIERYGMWQEALSIHEWDAIAIQTYHGSDGAAELKALRYILSVLPEGQRPVLYLYLAWPNQPFEANWNAPYTGSEQPVNMSHDFYAWWARKVMELDLPVSDVRVIPVAPVMAALIEAGVIGDASEFYRDIAHATEVLRYVAALTATACLFNGEPTGLVKHGAQGGALDPFQLARVREITAQVIAANELHPDRLPITASRAADYSITFRALIEHSHTVQVSADLETWTDYGEPVEGTGLDVTVPLPDTATFARVVRR